MTQNTMFDDTQWDSNLQNLTDLGQNITKEQKYHYAGQVYTKSVHTRGI
jgi:hypothetical protein